MKNGDPKRFTERKYKNAYEYLKGSLAWAFSRYNKEIPDEYINGYAKVESILNFTINFIEENYRTYDLRLEQMLCLIQTIHKEIRTDEETVLLFDEVLYPITYKIISRLGKEDKWLNYKLIESGSVYTA